MGRRVLWYEIQGILGQGGFGITYRAQDTNLEQPVAVKEYLPSMFATRGTDGIVAPTSEAHRKDFEWGLSRFIDEGRTLARFDHPGIVRVHSVFEESGTAYLVMRYEEGEPLDKLLKRQTTLPEEQIKRVLFDVMDGLVHVHDAGFIHRDIKPANIYLRGDHSAVLIDFGSARQALGVQTQTLTTLVSPGYAPFEQYYSDSAQQGPWTDIYALAATAFRAMTGRAPMPAVDRSKALLNNASDFINGALDGTDNEYSAPFRHAIACGIAFREQDRPQSIAAWRNLFDVDAASAAAIPASVPSDAVVDVGLDPEPQQTTLVINDEKTTQVYKQTEKISSTEDSISPTAKDAPPGSKRRYAVTGVVVVLMVLALAWRPWQSDKAVSSKDVVENTGAIEADENAAPDKRVALSSSAAAVPEDVPNDNAGDSRSRINTLPPAHKTSPPAAINRPAPEPALTVKRLLALAATDRKAGHLTRPTGNNALEKYQTILAREPGNKKAKAGLDKIVRQNVDLAKRAMRARDFEQAYAFLDEAALADASHPKLLRARKELAKLDYTPSLTEALIDGAVKLTDKKSIKKMQDAKKALEKRDYVKALDLLNKSLGGK